MAAEMASGLVALWLNLNVQLQLNTIVRATILGVPTATCGKGHEPKASHQHHRCALEMGLTGHSICR